MEIRPRSHQCILVSLLVLIVMVPVRTKGAEEIPKITVFDPDHVRKYIAQPVGDGDEMWTAMLSKIGLYDADITNLNAHGELAKLKTLQLSDTLITDAAMSAIALSSECSSLPQAQNCLKGRILPVERWVQIEFENIFQTDQAETQGVEFLGRL